MKKTVSELAQTKGNKILIWAQISGLHGAFIPVDHDKFVEALGLFNPAMEVQVKYDPNFGTYYVGGPQ